MAYAEDLRTEAPKAPQPPREGDPAAEYQGLDLTKYIAMWSEAADDYSQPRKASQRDRDYYDGDVKGTGEGHWTQAELKKLEERGQPPSVFNVIKRKVNATIGVELRTRSEPRAQPRTPMDQKKAEVATDALRYVKETVRWSSLKSRQFEEMLIEGTCAVELSATSDTVNCIEIDHNDFFFDPRSRRRDFSDARYLGSAKWVDEDVAVANYAAPPELPEIPPPPIGDPVAMPAWQEMASQAQAQYEALVEEAKNIADAIKSTIDLSLVKPEFEDRPRDNFGDRTRRRVFIVDMWHRDAKTGWYHCVFTGKAKLFSEPASMIDPADKRKVPPEKKRKIHPIVAGSCHVSRELWRYGMVRDMISAQDDANKRRSKSLDLLLRKSVKVTQRMLAMNEQTKESIRSEAARPDSLFVVADHDDIQVDHQLDLSEGHAKMFAGSMEFLDGAGPNLQLQGQQGQAGSGRAILALQQAGLGQLGPEFEALHDWELRVYRMWWSLIQQYWTGPMYVRVTDDKDAAKFAAVNGAPVFDKNGAPQMEDIAEHPGEAPPDMVAKFRAARIPAPRLAPHPENPQQLQMQAMGPAIADLDMDIILDIAPETATLQAEQFETLSKLAQAGMPIPADAIIESSALPNKSAILDKIKNAQEEAASKPMPPQQAALMEKLKTEIELAQSNIAKNYAQTELLIAQAQAASAEASAQQTAAIIQALDAKLAALIGGIQFQQPGAGLAPNPTPSAAPNGPALGEGPQRPPAAGELSGDPGLPPTLGAGPPPAMGVNGDPTTQGNGPPL